MLEECVHSRHQYLATTVESAPAVRGSHGWRIQTNSFCAAFIELLPKTGERNFLKNTVITTQGEGPQQCSEKPPSYPEHTNASVEPLFITTLIVQLEITAYKVQLRNTAKKPWNVRIFSNNKSQT